MLRYRAVRLFVAASMFAMVSGCGGGGSSGGGNVVTVPPTPTPSPTPTPTPTPTGSTFFVGAGAALIGEVTFDSNSNGIFGGTIVSGNTAITDLFLDTNTSGLFGPVAVSRVDGKEVTVYPTAAMRAFGIDMLSGYSLIYLSAPKGATTVSPVTTLLRSADDDVVATNTGLGLSAREISSFAAVPAMLSNDDNTAALGRRVTAYNLKLSALAVLTYPSNQAIQPNFGQSFERLQATIGEQFLLGRVDLNNASTIHSLIGQMPRISQFASPDVRRAISDLLARYGSAIDLYLTEPRRAADIQHGYRLVVLPAILDILERGNSIADADSITTESLLASFYEFADIPSPKIETRPYSYLPVSVFHSLVAVTDLRSIVRRGSNGVLTLRAECPGSTDDNAPPFCNDQGIASIGSLGTDRNELKLRSVRVPEKFSARLSASVAPDGEITLRQLNGSVGLVWFEYEVVHTGGLTATGRTYVRMGLSN